MTTFETDDIINVLVLLSKTERGLIMTQYGKLNISLPQEMLEIIDMFAEYEGLTRSGAIGYLLAQGLCMQSMRTNGFDFDNTFDVITLDNGETVTLKHSDVMNNRTVEWVMSCGRNRRKEIVTVSDKDFHEIDEDSSK